MGTGIFLSTVFLGLILLYAVTKDRWRWRRIAFIMIGIVAFTFTATMLILYYNQTSAFHRIPLTALDGIKIGEQIDDVLFRRGKYDRLCYYDKSKRGIGYEFRNGSGPRSTFTFVDTQDGIVQRIVYSGDVLAFAGSGPARLHQFDTEETLREKWGKEEEMHSSRGVEGVRHYVYPRYNFGAVLMNNKMIALMVFKDPAFYKNKTSPDCVEQKTND
jgi:hypothetical protein